MDQAGRSAPRHSFFLGGASPDHVCDTMGRPQPPDHIRARMDMIRSIYIHADVNIYIYVVRRAKNRNMDGPGRVRLGIRFSRDTVGPPATPDHIRAWRDMITYIYDMYVSVEGPNPEGPK